MATWAEVPRSRGRVFYDRLQELLRTTPDLLRAAEGGHRCRRAGIPHAHDWVLRRHRQRAEPSRGVAQTRPRCAIACSCRTGRRFPIIPGCRARGRISHEAREMVFGFVLNLVAERGW